MGVRARSKVTGAQYALAVTSSTVVTLTVPAAAIVADMGGLISHAATVAREFKTPTVLQTKFATKILKDGDLIEVNANIGTIRIISKG